MTWLFKAEFKWSSGGQKCTIPTPMEAYNNREFVGNNLQRVYIFGKVDILAFHF